MKRIVFSLATLLFSAAVFASSAPANWQIADKYNVNFAAGGEVGGIFKTLKGTIAFDEQNLASSAFDITIDVASVNTGNGLMNTHFKSAEWFDAAKYPAIHFTSKKIEKTAAGYQVTGDMEMHGVRKEMTLAFTFQNKGTTALFAGKFTVNRSDFHIGKPGGEVDEKVTIDIKIPVVKK